MIEILNPRGEKSGWIIRPGDRSLEIVNPEGKAILIHPRELSYRRTTKGEYLDALCRVDAEGDTLRPEPLYGLPRFVEQRAIREVRKNQARALLPPGATIYTIMVHRSTSGMKRIVKPMCIYRGELISLVPLCASLLGYRTERDGVVINGCGFNAGYEVMANLAHALLSPGQESYRHMEG